MGKAPSNPELGVFIFNMGGSHVHCLGAEWDSHLHLFSVRCRDTVGGSVACRAHAWNRVKEVSLPVSASPKPPTAAPSCINHVFLLCVLGVLISPGQLTLGDCPSQSQLIPRDSTWLPAGSAPFRCKPTNPDPPSPATSFICPPSPCPTHSRTWY